MLSKKEMSLRILKERGCTFIENCSVCPLEDMCWDKDDNAIAPPFIIAERYLKDCQKERDDMEFVIGLVR